jgi:DNA-binding transcriptional regulator YiaG
MTADDLKRVRRKLGWTTKHMAEQLRISDGRTVRRWEAGDRAIPGPVEVALEFFVAAAKKAK